MSETPKEKPLLASLRGKTLAKTPFWLMRQAGRYLPEYRKTRAVAGNFLSLCYDSALACEVTLQPLRRYQMDGAILFADILLVPHALGQSLVFETGEGPKLTPIQTYQDLSALSLMGLKPALAPVFDTLRRLSPLLASEFSHNPTLIGFAGAPWTVASYMVEGGSSRDFSKVKLMAWQEPALFSALCALLVEATTEYLSAQIEAGAEVVQIFDSWAGSLDEDGFQRWVILPTKKIVEELKARHKNVPIIGFPRGAGYLYERYAGETGVDAVSLDSQVSIEQALHIQKNVVIQGMLDPVLLVAGGEMLEKKIFMLLEQLGPSRYIFNFGHGILQQTPPENVKILSEKIRSFYK
jgi:uroporphyrinogen decarboxylase